MKIEKLKTTFTDEYGNIMQVWVDKDGEYCFKINDGEGHRGVFALNSDEYDEFVKYLTFSL
jgi:hypothetical protein